MIQASDRTRRRLAHKVWKLLARGCRSCPVAGDDCSECSADMLTEASASAEAALTEVAHLPLIQRPQAAYRAIVAREEASLVPLQ